MKNNQEIKRYETSSGLVVYRLPVLAFPKHVTNCYLVMTAPLTLVDCGSGWVDANESLVNCFERLGDEFGEPVKLEDVDRLIITHGHIDHFGGANFVVDKTNAELAIHELDVSTIKNFEERLIVSSKDLHIFLDRSGIPEELTQKLVERNKWSKGTFHPAKVDLALTEGVLDGSPFTIYHTPGHCPGQVCMQVDDVLFTADHVLSRITPNQAPEAITRNMGLGHYLQSLRKIEKLDGVRIGLGGHEDEIDDVPGRVRETIAFHEARLEKAEAICSEPKTLHQISIELFGPREGYHVLLALLETGAHIEYLYERGRLGVANHEKIEYERNPVLLYERM